MTKKGNRKENATGKLIKFPKAVKIDKSTMLANIAVILNQHVDNEEYSSSISTRKELLICLVERLIIDLEITREDILSHKKLMSSL